MKKSIFVIFLSLILTVNLFATADSKKVFKIGINNFGQANFLLELEEIL